MNKNQQYKSDALVAIHKTMSALYEIGAIDSMTMQEFDQDCLKPIMISELDADLDNHKPEYITQTYIPAAPIYSLGVGAR